MWFDGAFGTYYMAQTNDDSPCEQANLTNPTAVRTIHRAYIAAGVDAIKTNTFAATDPQVVAAGYALAMEAASQTSVSVFADIGPKADQAEYLEVTKTFLDLGAENFLFETLPSFEALLPSLEEIKRLAPQGMVIVSFAASRDGFSQSGQPLSALLLQAAENVYVDAIGLNCICGPAHSLELVRALGAFSKPLAVMPNSGYSATLNGRTIYRNNTEYFAQKMVELHEAGASILGGCCGTTPEHIDHAIKMLKNGAKNVSNQTLPLPEHSPHGKRPRKPIAVELHPPVDTDIDFVLRSANTLKQIGVDTITLVDSPMSKARADSFLTASLVKRETGLNVLPHLTCRDKNFIAIKGALLGASFYGVNQVLAITGDPIVNSDNYRNPGVFNFNAKELIGYIKDLNEQLFVEQPFAIGGALNVNAARFDVELLRAKEKIAAGAEFLYSQPMFSEVSIENFKQARQELDCDLFAGILPIVSYKNALFLNNELSGIDIPQHVVDSLQGKTSKEAQEISVRFVQDVIHQVYTYADGFYIMTPMKKVDLVCKLILSSFL